jgi:hypothetical protein
MSEIALNVGQKLYVITNPDGYTCLGFDKARDHANHIADLLGRPDLAQRPCEWGTLQGYARYLTAVDYWRTSPRSKDTYFESGTDPKVARILERYRDSGDRVRLIFGNPETGESWLEEHDVLGRIGRTTGGWKAPILVPDGEIGGGIISTSRVLAIIDQSTGGVKWRHENFGEPELEIVPCAMTGYAWSVRRSGGTQANFKTLSRAAAYVAFMCGAAVEPHTFQ